MSTCNLFFEGKKEKYHTFFHFKEMSLLKFKNHIILHRHVNVMLVRHSMLSSLMIMLSDVTGTIRIYSWTFGYVNVKKVLTILFLVIFFTKSLDFNQKLNIFF